MSSLNNFNQTIQSLEEESVKLREMTSEFKRIHSLTSDHRRMIADLDKLVNGVEANKAQMEAALEALKGKFADDQKALQALLQKNHQDFSDEVEKFRRQNQSYYTEMADTIKLKLDDHELKVKRLLIEELGKIDQSLKLQTEAIDTAIQKTASIWGKRQNIAHWIIGGMVLVILVLEIISVAIK